MLKTLMFTLIEGPKSASKIFENNIFLFISPPFKMIIKEIEKNNFGTH